ncbi:Cullin-associated NEDD8-dissociated protein 1 [Coemansia spiralis]|uniref:Cullin-associated NEDD8-dissociated protein 1 n=2 Tax=Coemansia TaxID=4863 RepID=A0A9W8GCZ5_9FUNG|nr:Cullin-associated NEDD8-dissociated protein 1 [Coemansia umbellata]KAJ2624055.1 Cullin-associated NEDD8-dissociated protein 1 [Coemansia sp. RSA 1358]KAJ2679663.1 Cullin-associated NEDD8-dissociated protein 1 [Coemansia spiralis]
MSSDDCNTFLSKMDDSDKDIRIVALTDLIETFKENSKKISNDDAKRYTDTLFKALDDSQSYVQNLATECLAACIKVIDTAIAINVAKAICDHIAGNQSEKKANAMSVALRVMTSRIAEGSDNRALLAQLAIPIVNTLTSATALASDVIVDIFTALMDVLVHAGTQIANDDAALNSVQRLLLNYISNKNTAVSRRTITVLGTFVVCVPGEQSKKALDIIFQRYKDAIRDNEKCMLLRVLVTIARQKPELIRSHIGDIINRELEIVDEADNELRVASLLAMKTFVAKAPDLTGFRIDDIYTVGVNAIRFDPDYNYDDESDQTDDMDTTSEDGLDDEFDEDIYEDNEDISWDIRLSGVKLLSEITESGLFSHERVVQDIGAVFVECFREREDVVRAEILLKYAKIFSNLGQKQRQSQEHSADMDIDSNVNDMVRQQIPSAVAAILSAIKNYPKHVETKQLAFAIFTRFVPLSISAVDSVLSKIMPLVISTLESGDIASASQAVSTSIVKTNIKIDALDFLLEYIKRTRLSTEADGFLFTIKDKIKDAASSSLTMVQTATCEVSSAILKLLRLAADSAEKSIEHYLSWANEMTEVVLTLVNTKDHALRISSYSFIGTVLYEFGDLLNDAVVDNALKVLTDWNQGIEMTQSSIGALLTAVTKPTHLPEGFVASVASTIMKQANERLQNSNTRFHTAALELVKSLSEYKLAAVNDFGPSTIAKIVDIICATPESPPLPALRAFAGVCTHVSVDTVNGISSSLLTCLSMATIYDKLSADALEDLYRTVGEAFPSVVKSWEKSLFGKWTANYVQLDSMRLVKPMETAQMHHPINKLPNAAKSIIALRVGYYRQSGQPWSSEFLYEALNMSTKSAEGIAHVCLGLRAFGYLAIGGQLDENESLCAQLYKHIESSNGDVRGEAAFALGNYAGRFPDNFSNLFESAMKATTAGAATGTLEEASDIRDISGPDKIQAVKIAIEYTLHSKSDVAVTKGMWNQIAGFVQKGNSTISDVLAQGLAIIAVNHPRTFISQLASCVDNSKNKYAKQFFITVFRTVLADKGLDYQCNEEIKKALPAVLANISDCDVGIRRLCLLALYTVIQNKNVLTKEIVATIQPMLFAQTMVDDSLVRFVTMGPFKKRIDDGLETRKCAYQCVHVLVRTMPDAIDMDSVVDCVIRGIYDEQDIRTVVQQIVNESAARFPTAFYARLGDLVDAISKMQATKLGKNSVKQEIEKHKEMLKLTVGIVYSLERIFPKQAESDSKFGKLVGSLAAGPGGEPNSEDLAEFYKELKSPSSASAAEATISPMI